MQTEAPLPADLAIAAAHRRARRCRVAAVVVLVAGFISAGIVYWHGSRQADDLNDDPAMLGFNRATERQMGELYGKQGQLIEDMNDALKKPGTQAILIVIGSLIIAAGCWQFARMVVFEAQNAARPPAG